VPDGDASPSVFEWAGGLPALTRMTRLFYEKYVPEDPILAPVFGEMSPEHPQRVAAWLGEVFGNLLRPVALDPSWLTPDVTALAEGAYQERSLPDGLLDPVRLALVADALEDAGCTREEVLGHLRGPGPHVRGCWVVDLLTGRG
jgi:hypothetical protein